MDDGQGGDARESGSDLFDRWLANRDPQAPEPEPDEPGPEPSRGEAPEPSPEAAVEPAEEPVVAPDAPAVLDPLFDESFPTDESEPTLQEPDIEIPDLTPESATPAAPAAPAVDIGRSIVAALASGPDDAAEPAQPPPPGLGDFEPVLTASARNRKPEPRRGRRSKRRPDPDTGADTETDTGPDTETDAQPDAQPDTGPDSSAAVVAPSPPPTTPEPLPEPELELKQEPEPEPPPKAAPTPDHVDAGREVFAAFATPAAPTTEVPAAKAPKAPRAPGKQKKERRDKREKKAGERPGRDGPASRRPASELEPTVVQALLGSIGPAAPSAPAPAEPVEPAPAPATPAAAADRREPGPDAGQGPVPDRAGYAVAAVGVSTNADFAPRTGPRRLVGLLLLVSLVGTAVAGYRAYADDTTFNLGLAGTLGMLTLVIWAVRAGSAPVRMSVRSGQLEVVSSEGRFVFDLASRYTPIEVVGRPGRRGWKVLFLRRSMAPFVVDASMVDPEEFMRVLRQHRPDLP